MNTFSRLFLLLLVTCCIGCKKEQPEDKYLGTEHWVAFGLSDTAIACYDLGSVRRAGDIVLFNQRSRKDTEFNQGRKRQNLPLLVQTKFSVRFNCKKRTVATFDTYNDYEQGPTERVGDMKEKPVRSGSSGEKVFDLLCGPTN